MLGYYCFCFFFFWRERFLPKVSWKSNPAAPGLANQVWPFKSALYVPGKTLMVGWGLLAHASRGHLRWSVEGWACLAVLFSWRDYTIELEKPIRRGFFFFLRCDGPNLQLQRFLNSVRNPHFSTRTIRKSVAERAGCSKQALLFEENVSLIQSGINETITKLSWNFEENRTRDQFYFSNKKNVRNGTDSAKSVEGAIVRECMTKMVYMTYEQTSSHARSYCR